ncbi:MAG: glycosyltransferase family 4 protein [Chloroflexota bacterium]
MKDILLINNKPETTGIGRYSFSLYENLKKLDKRNFDFLTLGSFSKDNDSIIKAFLQNMKKLVNHADFLSKIPPSYKVYHLLNPNLGMLLPYLHPSVVTVHDISILNPKVSIDILARSYGLELPMLLGMQFNMHFINSADRILCLSNYTRNDLISILGIKKERIAVIYPGINSDLFKPRDKLTARKRLGLPINKPIMLHIGTDEPRKNSKTLIEALYLVKKKIPNVILIKIGDMREATRRLILTKELNDSVLHYKKVRDVSSFYNAADLFVFPSYYEGFGYPAAEAMASGCPIIAANGSSLTEVVGAGGILFPPFSILSLNEAITEVLLDLKKQTIMIEKGLEQVKKFDWKKCAETTLEIYETL